MTECVVKCETGRKAGSLKKHVSGVVIEIHQPPCDNMSLVYSIFLWSIQPCSIAWTANYTSMTPYRVDCILLAVSPLPLHLESTEGTQPSQPTLSGIQR